MSESPLIWLPRHKDIILPTLKAKIRGFYRMRAVRADGSSRLLADWFPNLITNGGLDQFAAGSQFAVCAVGSGNTAPAVTNTQLVSLVGSTTTSAVISQTTQSSSPYMSAYEIQFQFAIGGATGNLSEVGIGASTTNLFSRALILNGGGSPTTITILSSEALYVDYTLQIFPPLTDVTGTVTLNGVVYNTTVRASNVTSPTFWCGPNVGLGLGNPNANYSTFVTDGTIGAITAGISGGTGNTGTFSITNGPYTNGSYSYAVSVSYALTAANYANGIQAWGLTMNGSSNGRGCFQIGFASGGSPPGIAKTASYTLVLNAQMSWTA